MSDAPKIMTKRQMRAVISKIERHKAAIGKHRDALREILDDLEEIEDCARDATESLNYAIQRLSEQL